MARNPPPERKELCLAAMRRRLAETPAGAIVDWAPVYAEFPEIARSNIWTWGKRLKEGAPSKTELNAAAKEIQTRVESGAVADHLPAVPAPAAIARDGGAALRRIDFAAEIPRLYADAEMLRAFSVKDLEGEDGQTVERIKNPVTFEKSIKARAGIIETGLKLLQEVWDMRAMQQFNELIIDEIGRESPECQRRILQRLALLNQRHGINFHGMRV